MVKKQPKIKPFERDKIANLLSSGVSIRSIARELGRSHSSILYEIKKNGINDGYLAIKANSIAKTRNTSSRKINPLKDPTIYSYVLKRLREGWSPEEIAGRLRKDNDGETVICHETIYRYIYSKEGRRKRLFEYLVRGNSSRRQWFGRHKYQRGIPDRTSIDLRPEYINSKKVFGHWEVDSVEGKAHKKGINTFLERKTRYYQGRIIEKIDSEYGIQAQINLFEKLPLKARKSATFDNGSENFNHSRLNIHLKMKTYFCDPYSAWQKGANEHFNGVLRRYIPKGTNLQNLTQIELDAILEEINNRPLKCLRYETPSEAFRRELKSITN